MIETNEPMGERARLTPVIRPARPLDTPEVMDLDRTIWDGDDYIPYVWEDWLADPHGKLVVAEVDGHVLGFGRLVQLSPQDWWLEGLRTHPEYQGRGIASSIQTHLVETWREIGGGTVRLATASFRFPVHRLCERTGFDKIGEYVPYIASGIPAQTSSFLAISPDQVGAVAETIQASPTLPLLDGLMNLGWRFAAPCDDFLQQVIERGRGWWWHDRQGLLLLGEDTNDDGQPNPFIEFLACPVESVQELLVDYRHLAAALNYQRAGWLAPLKADLLPVLEAAGFQREWDASIFIYAKKHPMV